MTPPALASFKSAAAFRSWLTKNHGDATELTVRLFKTHAADRGLTYAEALDEALCFGWIDGVRRGVDAESFSVRFSPRRPKSIWSRVNIAHVERLIAADRMAKPGLAAFEARDEDRTGVYSFERATATLPESFETVFRADKKAWAYFQSRAPWYRRTTTHWVMSAKRAQTREKRLRTLIECSAEENPIRGLERAGKGKSRTAR